MRGVFTLFLRLQPLFWPLFLALKAGISGIFEIRTSVALQVYGSGSVDCPRSRAYTHLCSGRILSQRSGTGDTL
jgi:hypothetical protein